MAVTVPFSISPPPSTTSPDSGSSLFPITKVAPLEIGIIFVGVVPFLSLIVFAIVKLHHRLHRQQHMMANKDQAYKNPKKPSDADFFLRLKPELGLNGPRLEMSCHEQHEKPADEIVELPSRNEDLRIASQRWRQELAGEGHSKELEASH